MVLSVTPSIDPRVLLVGVVVAALLLTLIALAVRARHRQRAQSAAEVPPATAEAPAQIVKLTAIDGAALSAALREAEAEGATNRIPGLYLSLAQWQVDAGDTRAAGDLLRKCIRAATSAGNKDAHAKARLALGDIAQSAGDPVTACEHWQIARKLFHELKSTHEFRAVDARMLRNGCPTDWVLTDF